MMKKQLCAALALCILLAIPYHGGWGEEGEDYSVDLDGFAKGVVNARAAVHDPSIIAVDGVYYIFGSHMAAARSDNLRNWTRFANGYQPTNAVWGNLFEEGLHVFDYAGGKNSLIPTDDGSTHVWAPDVIYNPVMGKYMMYYCTSSTWNTSNLCFAVSDTVEGPYQWQGALIYSGFDKKTLSATDVLDTVDEAYVKKHYFTLAGTYKYKDWPNAIDPALFFDRDGRLWMVYGSWSGGIFLLEIDPATGLVIHPQADENNQVDPYFGKKLMGGGHKSMEGPYIQYDPDSGYYYLFVSYGGLNTTGGYQIRVFRSQSPDGEYVDMEERRPDGVGNHAAYGLKLSGNYNLPSLRRAYMATGHNSAFFDGDGKKYICYHTRFNDGTETHQPMVKQYFLNAEGWPCMLPYAAWGETISLKGYSPEETAGRYYVVNQGTDISARIAEPFILYLRADGTVSGENVSGVWQAEEGRYFMRVTIGEKEFSGVFCRMKDDAGTDVMAFSAVGGNESLWGVKYD